MEAIQKYAQDKKISENEATQVFLQVLVLKHVSLEQTRFMGGTALVMGYGNPRFSEDIDLTHVSSPFSLAAGLKSGVKEASEWLHAEIKLKEPKKNMRSWVITYSFNPAHIVRLHIDTQPYRAYTTRPIVIEFPSLTSFVCNALTLEEILAEKILALAFRKYLGGRDLFDLWFHWLRKSDWFTQESEIYPLVELKLKERKLDKKVFNQNIKTRLLTKPILNRARLEWNRYLPTEFQKESVFRDITDSNKKLLSLLNK
ncbi:MAG: nucleotidyl transferase AbiEii/AbiGii toxin family protein [Deltaproteobacteria bacterium]|nr:nucleotidyl transferase AbiEii/AbiGii toxin family protein [Deltaproteobacteria bacterium]